MFIKVQVAINKVAWIIICGAISLWSCHESVGPETTEMVFERPPHFPEPTYTFENNPITREGFELGRRLFFDPLLSRDNSVSCNNCHQQSRAFADSPLHPTSVGIENKFGTRNAPALNNLAFMDEFFWDGGVTHLDFVPINAIESDVEMGETLEHVVRKLNDDEEYPELFSDAFGVKEITAPFMLHALSQFTAMMVSGSSRYDQYVLGERTLSQEELEGMALFESKCASCHSGELFSDFSFRNNGLSLVFGDKGRALISESAADDGKFRVPSLRNVEITAPYMHNARFETLEEVLAHYADGMVDSPTIDPAFKNDGKVVGIPMTQEEKYQIISFLKTLTDDEFITDPKFMNHD